LTVRDDCDRVLPTKEQRMATTDRILYTRREFGGLVLAGLPLSLAFAKAKAGTRGAVWVSPFSADSKFNGVQIGAITYSYRSIPDANAIVKAMADEGLSEVEVMSNHVEALLGAPAQGPGGGGRRGLTPEEQAAAQAAAKQRADEMKAFRQSLTPERFAAVRKTFNDAGIEVRLLTYNMNPNTTDEDIEYGFQMASGLGVKAITTSTQVSMAKRIAPFADRHKMVVGFHGHDQTDRPDEVSSEATFEAVMAASPYHWCNLDIGHYTAANGDPVDFIQKHHARITNLHVKDRKKDHGPNMPFGMGDTPIKEVLQLLKKERYDIPANIEFEYNGDPLVEIPKCIEYCKAALA
jgi:sugar phosphate isomerase/epimerase